MFRKLLSFRISPTIAGKRIALPLITMIPLAIVLCCCGCFAAAMVDTAMREAGWLPTYTPSPTRSPVPSKTPTVILQPTTKPSPTHSPTAAAKPSPTPAPTATPSPTPRPTETPTPTPTKRPTSAPSPTPTLVSGARVIIISVNKVREYVDLKNIGDQPQDLTGWRLVSERGNQTCVLQGIVLQPGEVLRVWANNPGGGGYNCGFGGEIWNNNEPDPAALYNAQGELVGRYPQ